MYRCDRVMNGASILCQCACFKHVLIDGMTQGTYAVAIKTVLVEDALPKGRRDLVTCLTTGESVNKQREKGIQ